MVKIRNFTLTPTTHTHAHTDTNHTHTPQPHTHQPQPHTHQPQPHTDTNHTHTTQSLNGEIVQKDTFWLKVVKLGNIKEGRKNFWVGCIWPASWIRYGRVWMQTAGIYRRS